MTSLNDARIRSALISERIRQRTDHVMRELIDSFAPELDFHPLEDLMISEQAWEYIVSSRIKPNVDSLVKSHRRGYWK